MKSRTGILILFLATVVTTNACKEEFEVFEGGTFSLRLNEPKSLIDGSVIELINVEDSRCPHEAGCVWEGRSAVTLRWKRDATYDIKMNDVEYVHEQVEGYLITLLEVSPYPSSNNMNEEKLVKINIEIN